MKYQCYTGSPAMAKHSGETGEQVLRSALWTERVCPLSVIRWSPNPRCDSARSWVKFRGGPEGGAPTPRAGAEPTHSTHAANAQLPFLHRA